MNAQALQSELEEALLRGMKNAFQESHYPTLDGLAAERMMRERAANLAAGYAARTHADAETSVGLAVEALMHAADTMKQALAGKDIRHNDRRRLALAKIEAAIGLWGKP